MCERRKTEERFLHFEKKMGCGSRAFVLFVDILSDRYESFDYFGFTFKNGRLDKDCFFLYNIVR